MNIFVAQIFHHSQNVVVCSHFRNTNNDSEGNQMKVEEKIPHRCVLRPQNEYICSYELLLMIHERALIGCYRQLNDYSFKILVHTLIRSL